MASQLDNIESDVKEIKQDIKTLAEIGLNGKDSEKYAHAEAAVDSHRSQLHSIRRVQRGI